jgi:hypothetical protein
MSGPVNKEQIKAMGDIMRSLSELDDGGSADTFTPMAGEQDFLSETALPATNHIPNTPAPVSDANVEAMRSIMSLFREATDDMREAAQDKPALMEALCTERTERGVRIAEWEIVVTEKKEMGKFYDVICDDLAIATDLRLYEAALLLTQELNRGSSITSPTVRHILALEAQYARNLDDAIRYSRIVKLAEGAKREIALSRLTESKAKALAAKEQISEIR